MRSLSEPAFLVIDAGTGGIKCLVFDGRGSLVFRADAPINFNFSGYAIDFSASQAWNNICRLVRLALRACSKRDLDIVSVSSTSMREGNVFLDRSGRELLAVPNMDSRAAEETKLIEPSFADLIYDKSGHWPSSIFLLSRLRWLRGNRPSMFRKISKVSMINDWILYKFSNQLFSEPTNACETSMFDLSHRNWSAEIIKESGFESSIFPQIRECGTNIGPITREVSERTGLGGSTSVIVGAADTEAAVAGCGVFEPENSVAVAGTTTPVQAVTNRVVLDGEKRTWSCCHVIPNRWVLESNAGATGLVMKWWSDLVGMKFSKLDEEAFHDRGKTGRGRVEVDMGVAVMNAKNPHPLSGSIRNLGIWTRRAEITRGIIEANCFSVKANLEQLETVLAKKTRGLFFCGGSASSRLWMQLQADILKREFVRFKSGVASGVGVAMLSAVSLGKFSELTAARRSFLREKELVKPSKVHMDYLDDMFKEWIRNHL